MFTLRAPGRRRGVAGAGPGRKWCRGMSTSPDHLAPSAPPQDWDAANYDRVAHPQARWGCSCGRPAGTFWRRNGSRLRVRHRACDRPAAGAAAQGRVLALDTSLTMLEEARRRLAGAGDRFFVEADLRELDPTALGPHAPVDAIFSTATFHWITDHDRLFRNLASVLGPRGAAGRTVRWGGQPQRPARGRRLPRRRTGQHVGIRVGRGEARPPRVWRSFASGTVSRRLRRMRGGNSWWRSLLRCPNR